MLKSAVVLGRYTYKHILQPIRCTSRLPQLSSEKYNVKRKDYATLQPIDVNFFRCLLSEERVLTDDSDVLPFNVDWLNSCRGQSKVVLKPKSTQEVSKILAYCNERRLAVCPQGGNTGIVGASVPVFDEIILHMGLMNQIISLDEISATDDNDDNNELPNDQPGPSTRDLEVIQPIDEGMPGPGLSMPDLDFHADEVADRS